MPPADNLVILNGVKDRLNGQGRDSSAAPQNDGRFWTRSILPLLFLFYFFTGIPTANSAEIEKQISGSPGGIGSTGTYILMGAIQSAAGVAGGGGTYTTLSGYLTFRSTNTYLVQTLGGLKTRNGWLVGVPTQTPVGFHFSGPLAHGTLASAFTVRQLEDNLRNPVETDIPFTVFYDTAQVAAKIILPPGWDFGNSYRISMTTQVLDADLNPVSGAASVRILAMSDFAERNVVTALDDAQAEVDLAPNAYPGTGFVLFHSNPMDEPDRIAKTQIETANRKALTNFGAGGQASSLKELNAYDSQGNKIERNFSAPVRLSVPFADANRDGRLDSNPSARVKSLRLWVLDERTNLWVRVPGSQVDSQTQTVSAPLQHFSVYSILAAPDHDVDLVYPFPIPWRPSAGDAARYGTATGGITFANLPQEGSIEIFTLGGRLVREEHLSGSSVWAWDVRNEQGEEVASGVYLWVIKSGSNRKTGKLMVVR